MGKVELRTSGGNRPLILTGSRAFVDLNRKALVIAHFILSVNTLHSPTCSRPNHAQGHLSADW
jgi:hypothetical protein